MSDTKEKRFKTSVDEVIDNNGTIKELKTDVSQLKTDVSQLKDDQVEIKTELHRQGLIQEDMYKKMNTIAEAVTPLLRHFEKAQRIENELQDQKDQIDVTQVALRQHMTDPCAHTK
jgi:DNA repair exonuclease SbcCD ATPase subunit